MPNALFAEMDLETIGDELQQLTARIRPIDISHLPCIVKDLSERQAKFVFKDEPNNAETSAAQREGIS